VHGILLGLVRSARHQRIGHAARETLVALLERAAERPRRDRAGEDAVA
jgi:hypothetical protein